MAQASQDSGGANLAQPSPASMIFNDSGKDDAQTAHRQSDHRQANGAGKHKQDY